MSRNNSINFDIYFADSDTDLVSKLNVKMDEIMQLSSSLSAGAQTNLETQNRVSGGPGSIPVSYPDYIDGKNKIFELYYEDGSSVATDPNEDLLIGISGVIQHDSAYSIDRTSVPNKVVFTSPPLWGQGLNTKTLQEPLAVDKFFAHSVGCYKRCEINKKFSRSY